MTKALKLIILSLLFSNFVTAQYGYIKIHVIDSATKEPMPFVNIATKEDTVFKYQGATNDSGELDLNSIKTGTYKVVTQLFGYYEFLSGNIDVISYEIKNIEIKLRKNPNTDSIIMVHHNCKPPIQKFDSVKTK